MEESKAKSFFRSWRDVFIAIVIIVIILLLIRPTIVMGRSMEGTLYDKDYIFMSKQAYLMKDIERGDIIVFKIDVPGDDEAEVNYIKRVIGIPGDTVSIEDGEVFVNGEKLVESYINSDSTLGHITDLVIPEEKYFVLGDNRHYSSDSRDPVVGLIDEERIMGKAVFRLYPFSEIGGIK